MPPWQTVFRCKKCGEKYTAATGVVGYGHDKCYNVQRDREGFPWFPGEDTQPRTMLDGDGKVFYITRAQAFTPRTPRQKFEAAFPGAR